ncbi:MAG: flagellar filament capping protein FliD [Planctomycetota bacterium]|jgi:flagellar hook-associated protein 2
MGRIQSNIGLITGIDIAKTVDQLVSISAQPRDRLQNRVKGLETQQVAINELMAMVIAVQLQTTRLGSATNLDSTKVNSSRSEVLSATATGSPASGTYVLQAVQTAQSSTATSQVFANASEALETGELVVRAGGFVDRPVKLEDLRGGSGVSQGKIRIVDRGGVGSTVDLRFAATIEDVVKTINSATNSRVSAKLNGDRIVLSDMTGQTTSNLIVEELGDGRTAADLGISGVNVAANSATGDDLVYLSNTTRLATLRDQTGIAFRSGNDLAVTLRDGSTIQVNANPSSTPTTVGQLLSAINAVDSSKLEARIASDKKSIELVDKTSGAGAIAATGILADQLGLSSATAAGGVLTGGRVANALGGPLLSSLRGGTGIGVASSLSITNRAGVATSIDLTGSKSLRDIIDAINNAGAGVTASWNRSKTGIQIQDVTGSTAGNLVIANNDANNTATKLQLAANVSENTVDSGSLQLRYVSEATELSQLNQGRGVRSGTFEIVNSLGTRRSIDVGALTNKTLGGVIEAINGTGIGVQAAINDAGDGLVITDTNNGAGTFTISDRTGSLAAKDLKIAGQGQSQVVGGNTVSRIEGSGTFRLNVGESPTLASLVEKINQSDGPLTASLLAAGSTTRILFNSRASGEAGRVVIDGSDIGIDASTTSVGRDAIIAISPTEFSGGTLLRSSSNTMDKAIQGLSIRVSAVDSAPVEIRVEKDNSSIERNLQLLADQFNKVRDRLNTVASYDSATGKTGILYGSNEVLRVEQGLTRMMNQTLFSAGGFRSMEQLGLSLDKEGKLRLDSSKLAQAIGRDSKGVTEFLTKESTGFAAKSKELLENLVGAEKGVLVSRNESLQRRIDDSNKRIEFLNAKLDREREKLQLQFYRMEEAISRIRTSSSGLSALQAVAANASV